MATLGNAAPAVSDRLTMVSKPKNLADPLLGLA